MKPEKKFEDRPLSERETEVVWLVARGLANKEIADKLGVSAHAIKFHVENAMAKLKAANRTQAAVMFVLANVDDARARLAS